jgi:hypothetical protein
MQVMTPNANMRAGHRRPFFLCPVLCRFNADDPSVVANATEAFVAEPRQRREQVSARLDPDVIAVVEEVAAAERRPVSSVVRNVVTDWAAQRRGPLAVQERAA